MIARDDDHVIDWVFAPTENLFTWSMFLARLEGKPAGIVSDAQRGLLKAIRIRFGHGAPHQRCIAHIARQSRIWLTRQPKTLAGIELLAIVNGLHAIKNHEQAL